VILFPYDVGPKDCVADFQVRLNARAARLRSADAYGSYKDENFRVNSDVTLEAYTEPLLHSRGGVLARTQATWRQGMEEHETVWEDHVRHGECLLGALWNGRRR
jgi:hypothetical protein